MALGVLRLPHRHGVFGDFDITAAHFPLEEARILDEIVRATVVDRPSEGLQHANELLKKVDRGIGKLSQGFQDVKEPQRRCRVCGEGRYEMLADLDQGRQQNFGLNVIGQAKFKILVCSHCAHTQLFYFRDGLTPNAWG